MKAIDRPLTELEDKMKTRPCTKPGHSLLHLFIVRTEEDKKEIESKIADLRRCERCKNELVIVLDHWSENAQSSSVRRPNPINFTFDGGTQ